MKFQTCLSIAFSWMAALLIPCAGESPKSDPAPAIPDAVKVPLTESLSFSAKAKGVQIYECRAKKDDPTQYEWVFTGPEADLFDANGNKMGRHYAGPTWESDDGSRVVGSVKGSVASKDLGAVPWL